MSDEEKNISETDVPSDENGPKTTRKRRVTKMYISGDYMAHDSGFLDDSPDTDILMSPQVMERLQEHLRAFADKIVPLPLLPPMDDRIKRPLIVGNAHQPSRRARRDMQQSMKNFIASGVYRNPTQTKYKKGSQDE